MNRLAFPILSASDVRAMNSLVGTHRALNFHAADATWSLRFRAALPGFAPAWNVTLSLGGKPSVVELERLPDVSQCGPNFSGVKLEDLPREVWLAVLDAAFEEWLDAAERALQTSVMLEQIAEWSAENGSGLFFEITRDAQSVFLRGRFCLNAEDLQWLGQLAEQAPVQAGDGFHLLPFQGRIVIGETRLSLHDFERIERGDLVLLDRHGLTGDAPLCEVAFTPQLRFPARLQSGGLALPKKMADAAPSTPAKTESPAAKAPVPAAATTPAPAAKPATATPAAQAAKPVPAPAAAAAKPLESLPVQLVFEVGEKEITLDELKRLEPGFTFELDQTVDRPVTIQANGKAIGVGELVQIGERIGVRVLEWNVAVSSPAPAAQS